MTEYTVRVIAMPETQDSLDEMFRAKALALESPDIVVRDRAIEIRNGSHECQVTRCHGAWRGSCTYGRTHDAQKHPCCGARALELWAEKGWCIPPELLVLDERFLTGRVPMWADDDVRRQVWEIFCHLWRMVVQIYAERLIRQGSGDVENWYWMGASRLMCTDSSQLCEPVHLMVRIADTVIGDDLPEWLDTLCSIRDALLDLLAEPAWEDNLAHRDAFCDWTLSQSVPDWVQVEIEQAIEQLRWLNRDPEPIPEPFAFEGLLTDLVAFEYELI